MADPILTAKRTRSVEDFLTGYDPAVTPRFRSRATGETVLFGALANRDPQIRVVIANRLLDDGADPSAITTDGTTMVHVLLSQREHDPTAEAPLLRRLLDGGADVNKPHVRRGAPLAILYHTSISDEDAVPLYEVIFARPDLDLQARATRVLTVRQLILDAAPVRRPILQQMVGDHDALGATDQD